MGAHYIARTHPYCDRKTLEQWVREKADDDAFKHGHEDGGYWQAKPGGLVFREGQVFDDEMKAEEYVLAEFPEKSDPLVAVPLMSKPALPYGIKEKDKVRIELEEAYRQIQIEINQFHPSLVARAKAGKSALKGCTHCDSKISVQHLKSVTCPVCGGNLLITETDSKKLASLEKKKEAALKKVFDRDAALLKQWLKDNPDKAPQKVWYVGGLCRS